MTKYEVRHEHFETRKGGTDWTVEDLDRVVDLSNWRNPELIYSSRDLEKSQKVFEESKKNCCSEYVKGNCWDLVEFDYIEIDKVEYDEDGDIEQSEVWDYFIAEI